MLWLNPTGKLLDPTPDYTKSHTRPDQTSVRFGHFTKLRYDARASTSFGDS